jgi:hypothetical protein
MSDAPQGTSLEDIEMGQVKNEADAATMREILALADMHTGGEESNEFPTGGREEFPTQQPPPRMPMPSAPMAPPMMQQYPQMHPQQMYEQSYDEEEEQQRPKYKVATVQSAAPKKNTWSVVVDTIRDPLIVGVLVFVLSLPSLHTFVGRHASWAYKVGGQLSWVGLSLTALVGAITFGIYRAVMVTISK